MEVWYIIKQNIDSYYIFFVYFIHLYIFVYFILFYFESIHQFETTNSKQPIRVNSSIRILRARIPHMHTPPHDDRWNEAIKLVSTLTNAAHMHHSDATLACWRVTQWVKTYKIQNIQNMQNMNYGNLIHNKSKHWVVFYI